MRFIFTYILTISLFAAMGGCSDGGSGETTIPSSFNIKAVSGTMQLPDKGTDIALEDYTLSNPSGEGVLEYSNCNDLMALKETDTVPSEFFFFRRYAIDCYAAKAYLDGGAAKQSQFQGPFLDIVGGLPANSVPHFGNKPLFAARDGKTVARFFGDIKPIAQRDNSVDVTLDDIDMRYDLLARRDLNADGYQDLLIMVTYHLMEGSARGTKLYALSKTSQSAPIETLWAYE